MPAKCSNEFGVPHEAHRFGASHAGLDGGVRDHRGRRVAFEVIIAGAGGAAHLPGMMAAQYDRCRCSACRSRAQSLEGHRFAALDRADARRRSGRDAGDRQGGREKCRAAGGGDPGQPRPALREKLRAFRQEQAARVRSARTAVIEPDPSGRDHRRARQRAARAHVRDRRPPHGLSRPHVFTRRRHSHRPGGRCRDDRAVRRSGRRARVLPEGVERSDVRVRERALGDRRAAAIARAGAAQRLPSCTPPNTGSARRRSCRRRLPDRRPFCRCARSRICSRPSRSSAARPFSRHADFGYDGKGSVQSRRPR